ncbi:MAG: exo-alpha-sialidase, partial [Cohnella sp.]|nr:exo-alpha-sialidase [Cohnella sp.]
VRLPGGDWACQFELNKHYDDLAVWRHSSVLLFSKDEGKSWTDHVITSNDPTNRIFYWDQRPGVMTDGSLLNLFWTYDNETKSYLNIHARTSDDNGHTWSELYDTGVQGQPGPPVSFDDGKVAIVYVDRQADAAIHMRISDHYGTIGPNNPEFVLYKYAQSQVMNRTSMQDAWAEMGKYSVGLPVTARLSDRQLLVVYYAGAHADHTAIEWVHIRI